VVINASSTFSPDFAEASKKSRPLFLAYVSPSSKLKEKKDFRYQSSSNTAMEKKNLT
jgi:hypothetical protein